jgi:hypothetical protein
MKVEIISIKHCESGLGNVKAFATIKIGPLIINDFKVVQQPGYRSYVASPQTSYVNKHTGKIVYKNLLVYPDDWKEQINTAVMGAYNNDCPHA